MSSTGCTSKLLLVLTALLLLLPVVEAMDAGDTIAFLLGLAVSVVGFCACLELRKHGKLSSIYFYFYFRMCLFCSLRSCYQNGTVILLQHVKLCESSRGYVSLSLLYFQHSVFL
uniref:Uncharacterized protein n=1 Tax=Pavo cristatus TaxID=9049 RepID=A0A8C9LDB1_PAVCR